MPAKQATPHDRASLIVVAERLEWAARSLRSLVEAMDKAGLDVINMHYARSALPGLKYIDAFIQSGLKTYFATQGPKLPDADDSLPRPPRRHRRKGIAR